MNNQTNNFNNSNFKDSSCGINNTNANILNQINIFKNMKFYVKNEFNYVCILSIKNIIIIENPHKNIFLDYLFNQYFELRNIPSAIFNLKIFELLRYIFSFFVIIILAFGLFIYFKNFILVDMDRKTDFLFHIIFNMCLPVLFAIVVHYILEKSFIKDKGTIQLKLESSSKGRFYFTIDVVFFIFLFYIFI